MKITESYEKHESWYADIEKHLLRITVKDTIDYWRHDRMFRFLGPLLNNKDSKWLTIGDGIGSDAHWLLNEGINATASDIADNVIKEANRRSLINNFLKINAEDIKLNDDSFDYVLCKEAYHHFPRLILVFMR